MSNRQDAALYDLPRRRLTDNDILEPNKTYLAILRMRIHYRDPAEKRAAIENAIENWSNEVNKELPPWMAVVVREYQYKQFAEHGWDVYVLFDAVGRKTPPINPTVNPTTGRFAPAAVPLLKILTVGAIKVLLGLALAAVGVVISVTIYEVIQVIPEAVGAAAETLPIIVAVGLAAYLAPPRHRMWIILAGGGLIYLAWRDRMREEGSPQ